MLLLGVVMLRLGMTRGFGASLHGFIEKGTSNRIKSFVSGGLVTMLLQSSTATVLIVGGFAAQNLIAAPAALSAILGADVGTTIVARVLSLDLSWLAPLLMLVGYILYKKERSSKLKNLGRIISGLALILFALAFVRNAAAPLASSETLPVIFQALRNDAILAILASAFITWIMHSSLAFVLVLLSFVHSEVLPLDLALVMVLGANLGSTFAPFVATIKDVPAERRIAIGNMIMRFTGVAFLFPFSSQLHLLSGLVGGDLSTQVINFHIMFNVAVAIVFLPLTGYVAIFSRKLLPDSDLIDDPGRPIYLDKNVLNSPSIAISLAVRETLRMADVVERMLMDSMKAFKHNDESIVRFVNEQDDIIDDLYKAIKNYMARLNEEFMDEKEAARYIQILTFATNIEHAGDILDKNLMPSALKKIRKNKSFSGKGLQEIEQIHGMVMDSMRLAQSVFVSGDKDLANQLLKQKSVVRKAEAKASAAHFQRLRKGVPETFATSSLHMDIIRDLRRVNTHMCSVAYHALSEGEHDLDQEERDEEDIVREILDD